MGVLQSIQYKYEENLLKPLGVCHHNTRSRLGKRGGLLGDVNVNLSLYLVVFEFCMLLEASRRLRQKLSEVALLDVHGQSLLVIIGNILNQEVRRRAKTYIEAVD